MNSEAASILQLANRLLERGHLDDAVGEYRKAVALSPGYADAHNNLGVALRRQGKVEEALACHRQALALAPGHPDALINLGQLEFLLARDGLAPMPESAATSFVASLYGKRAADWDRSAAHLQKYRAPRLVADALRTFWTGPGEPGVLDAGCGTGLVGELVRSWARRLDGIDLSLAMLEKARAKGIYDALDHGDLAALMAERPRTYDAIAGAAALIHFGDLRRVFQAACAALHERGVFVFTLFPLAGGGADFAIAAAENLRLMGCFAHTPAYVARTAAQAGMEVESMGEEIHEYFDGQPVAGLLVALRRRVF